MMDPRHLWPQFARIISECQPEWVFLENVANHLNLGYREVRGGRCQTNANQSLNGQ